MTLTNIKNERKFIDSLVIIAASSSAYFGGFIQSLNLGPVSISILLPVGVIVFLAFMHVVLRKSRKFDEREHQIAYEILKGVVFTGLIIFSYRSGLSAVELIPQSLISSVSTLLFLTVAIYLMAYRSNKN